MRFNIYTLIFYFSLLNASFLNAQTLSNNETEFVNKMIEAIPSHYLSGNTEKRMLVSAKKEFANNGITLDSKILKKYLDLCSKVYGYAIKESQAFSNTYLNGVIRSCPLGERIDSSLVRIVFKLNSINISLFDQSDFTGLFGAYQTFLYNTDNEYLCNFFCFSNEYANVSKLYNYKKFELSEILITSDEFYKNKEIIKALPDAGVSNYVNFYLDHVSGISKLEYFELINLMSSAHKKISAEDLRQEEERRKEDYKKRLAYIKKNKDKLMAQEFEKISFCAEGPLYKLKLLNAELRQQVAEERQNGWPSTGSDSIRRQMKIEEKALKNCDSLSESETLKEIESLERILKN
jgi:hypothetical protein